MVEALLRGKASEDCNPSAAQTKEHPPETEQAPSINIEHIQVDKIIIEKLDYANNFGQLGIKELSGKLNIGTSYEGDISKAASEKLKQKLQAQQKDKDSNEGTEGKAKVNFRSKKEEE